MNKVQLGKSDISLSPVAFGAWAIGGWMWGGANKNDAMEAIHASIDRGVTTIDTAPVYGFGLSEEIVGKAVKGRRDKVEILTKYGLKWKEAKGQFYFDTIDNDDIPVKIYRYASKESVINECEDSLRRLKTDYIDLYQIHWSDPTTPVEETMEAIELLLEQGKIRAAGVCNYDKELASLASECIPLSSNQVPYSMLKRDIETDLVPWCIENNVSILAYSPLQRGLLTGKITSDYTFGKGDSRPKMPRFSPENISRVNSFLNKIKPIAEEHNTTLSQLVIAWTIVQPGITVALVGARDRKQAEENAGALSLKLSKKELNSINHSLSQLQLIL